MSKLLKMVFRYPPDDIRFAQPFTDDGEIDLKFAVVQNEYNQVSKKPKTISQNTRISFERHGLHSSYLFM